MSVDGNRLRDLTFELVECESPTGDTADVARIYAKRLAEYGLEVELLDDRFPRTPIVVGRLKGDRPGPTIVLNGHLDTVPIPHEPARIEGETIVGRGSADMKGACACAAEAVRVVVERGASFPGELVIVGIGLHEAPGGRGEDLSWLLQESGFTADYAVVCELAGDSFVAAHMGSATVEITVSRPGIPTHELQTPKGTPHPLLAAGKVIAAIEARTAKLAETEHPFVGVETYFLGELHGGDFYNRFPTTCRLVGTCRWAPGKTLGEVEADLNGLLAPIASEIGCAIEVEVKLVRDSYRIDPDEKLAVALREAYREVTGNEQPVIGMKVVADGAVFHQAGIATVYHGPVGIGAHADFESIEVPELVRATQVYLALLERLWA